MMDRWGSNWLITYFELGQGTNVAALEAKFPRYLKKYLATNEIWKYYELFLQPLKEVHGGSTSITHDYLNYQKFDSTYTYLFFDYCNRHPCDSVHQFHEPLHCKIC